MKLGEEFCKMYDIAIIGSGIVGLSTAMAIKEIYPEDQVVVIEKEQTLAVHQTGRNSGVIHSGIYYKPGSFKARFARQGNRDMVQFCEKHGIEYDICGKLIVATEEKELPLLNHLYERGLQNELDIHKLTPDEVQAIEPHLQAVAGIRVPSTGIVNYTRVAEVFADIFSAKGGEFLYNTHVQDMQEERDFVALQTNRGEVRTRHLINCAGLYSDRVAHMGNIQTKMKIIPFRGEYYELKPEKRHLVKHLIYPVPNPDFPFLGVHFSRMIDGRVLIGPNAVLSFKREGYTKTDFDLHEFLEVLSYPGFWKVALPNLKEGLLEMYRSLSKKAFVQALQKFIPEIGMDDIVPAQAGVRAQAISIDGKMLDDFVIIPTKNAIHVCNAPSPAATASLQIGKHIAAQVEKQKAEAS